MSRLFNWRIAVLLGIIAVAIISVLFFQEYLQLFLLEVKNLGIWAPILVGLAYIPACLFFIPGSLLTLGAGYVSSLTFADNLLLAVVVGTICVSFGSVLGAAAAFLAGRTIARGWIESKVAANPRFRALDHAVGEQGFLIVFLIRLSPLFPFSLLNYAFGLTKVPFWKYFLASWIGMLPGTLMYVYLGAAAGELQDLISGDVTTTPEQQLLRRILFVAGLIATIAVTVVATRLARQALAKKAPEVTSPEHIKEMHERAN